MAENSAYQNRSFEDVGGSNAVVTSSNMETFGLAAGEVLEIVVDGGDVQRVGMNPADFVDITNATAAEVVSAVTVQTIGVAGAVVGGKVVLMSGSEGDNASVWILGGSANDALQFPTDEPVRVANPSPFPPSLTRGKTREGDVNNWTIETVSSSYEYGEFDAYLTHAFESFDFWLSKDPFLFEFIVGDLADGLFAPSAGLKEDFESGWNNGPLELWGIVDGMFDSSTTTEGFELDWPASPIPPGTTAETFLWDLSIIDQGDFNPVTGPDEFDGFEDEWRGNQDFKFSFVGSPTDLDYGDFQKPSGTTEVETFGDDGAVTWQYVAEFTTDPPPTGLYRIFIDPFSFQVVGNGATSAATLAANLASQIDGGVVGVTASNVGGRVVLNSDDFSDLSVQVGNTVAASEFIIRTALEDSLYDGYWTGSGRLQA